MATIACPGCGLPRAKDQIGTLSCPVCHAAPAVSGQRRQEAKATTHNPLAALPADASELGKYAAAKRSTDKSRLPPLVFAFLIGIVFGIAGVLIWQHAMTTTASDSPHGDLVDEQTTSMPAASKLSPAMPKYQIAPMPRLATGSESPTFTAASDPSPELKNLEPPPTGSIVIHLNQPDATYTVPSNLRTGKHIIIRGKVKTLRVNGLGGSSILDASSLETATVFIDGTIDGSSILKLRSHNGVVAVAAHITGKSQVEINAAGGSVRFLPPPANGQGSAQIKGGALVTISARTVDIRGDVDGADTKVGATLPPGGVLKVAAVRGTATVEYSAEPAGGIAPDVTVGSVAPTAILKKRN